jgi:uncharacterized protein YdhG (YjbR/CyaY superfamily)
MQKDTARFTSIDQYISTFPTDRQKLLQQMRATIKSAAPQASEKISYQMPTFYLKGNLVHFACLKNHIGFYPTPSGIQAFLPELTAYQTSPGAVQFPLDQPLPLDLVTRVVKFRAAENLRRAEEKARKNPRAARLA